jgi:hypothetical protein
MRRPPAWKRHGNGFSFVVSSWTLKYFARRETRERHKLAQRTLARGISRQSVGS